MSESPQSDPRARKDGRPMRQPEGPFLYRVGLIGDVHGQDRVLEATLRFLQARPNLDAILCTGDLPGKQGNSNADRCCALIQEAQVWMIKGNHDAWAVDNQDSKVWFGLNDEAPLAQPTIDFMRSTPRTRIFETPLGSLLLCHGVGNDFMAGIYPFTKPEQVLHGLKEQRIYGWQRIMVAGHTHHRLAQSAGTVMIINPGTLVRDENPGFAIADFVDGTVQFYNLASSTNEITEAELLTPWTPEIADPTLNTQNPTPTPGVSHA